LKFKVTFKDPDSLHDAIQDAVEEDVNDMPDLDDEEKESVAGSRTEKIKSLCEKWFKWSEYLTVEIDTEAKTCVVLDVKD